MVIAATAGATLAIGTEGFVPSPDNDSSAYGTDTYIAVGDIETMGEIGDEATAIEILTIGNSRGRNLKGTRSGGVTTVTCILNDEDAGQLAMIAAEASSLAYPFRVVMNNKVTAMGTGSTRYFRGLVMSKRESLGGANDPIKITFNIGVNTANTNVAAT